MSSAPKFETVLPRLIATYESGRLVPFIGSGMSQRICTDWATFIRQLENASGGAKAARLDSKTPREVLIRRANNAVRTLKLGAAGAFAKAVREGLLSKGVDPQAIPPQTRVLAKLSWPLVLSTNYDNCYAAAFHKRFPERHLAIVGRGVEDCQRVLTSLSTAGRSLLWALQGYLKDLPYSHLPSIVTPDLEAQLVVGHEEYRRVTYRALHFRRAFAEVFRQRSLLFLGAGIQESYLQELFGEVLEFYGPATRPHYAFIQKGEVDPDFMLARFQIVVVEYPKGKHDEVKRRLRRLVEEVSRPRRTPVSWGWGRVERRNENNWTSVPDLEVVRGPLPTKRAKRECLAVSAGGSRSEFFFSPGILEVMKSWDSEEAMIRQTRNPYLGEDSKHHVYAVRARSGKDERSLAHIYQASLALFRHLNRKNYRCIRMGLLATGGKEKTGVSEKRWMVRSYPERFSFIQTVRAWAAWRKTKPKRNCRLALHVVLDFVYQDIASGRIDVLELLSCPDIRFFVEVVSAAGEVERRLFQAMPNLTLDLLVKDLQLTAAQWTLEVTPPPDLEQGPHALTGRRLRQTIKELGVVPGGTVHFRRAVRQRSGPVITRKRRPGARSRKR
jgi:SIR2-like domain